MRPTLRLIVGAGAVAGALAAALWWREPRPEVDDATLPVFAHRAPADTRIPPYRAGAIFCGENASGSISFSATEFETPIGTRLSQLREACDSEREARRAFDWRLREAKKILDTTGRCGTASRAVIMTSTHCAVMWREGRNVISLWGPTPGDVLAFERDEFPCAATLKEKGDSPL